MCASQPCLQCACAETTTQRLIHEMQLAVEATQQIDLLHDEKVPQEATLQYLHAPRSTEELAVWTMGTTLHQWRIAKNVEHLKQTLLWWLFNREVRATFHGNGLDSITVRSVVEHLHPCFARRMLVWALNCEHLIGSEKMDALLVRDQLETVPATRTSLEQVPPWQRKTQHGT